MDSNYTQTPRYKVVGHAYEQAEQLGFDWRFPCNPDIEDLCERATLAGMVPVITFLPYEQADRVFNNAATLVLKPISHP